MNTTSDDLAPAGRGPYWQELEVGQRFKTFRRLITETDLVNFIATTGMLETLFIDPDDDGPIGGRVVPAALTYSLIEGFIFQNLIQGVGLALLEVSMKALAPVRVGDRVWGLITITGIKPTSKGNRAIVTSTVDIHNQHDEAVLSYTVTRMLAGQPQA